MKMQQIFIFFKKYSFQLVLIVIVFFSFYLILRLNDNNLNEFEINNSNTSASGWEIIKFNDAGNILEEKYYVGAGFDNKGNTPDDVISTYSIYDYKNNTIIKKIQYDNPGNDDKWTTTDDIINNYSIFEYDIENKLKKEIIYNDKGKDFIWFTGDDLIDSYILHQSKNLILYFKAKGADSIWFTADDILDKYEIINFDKNHKISSFFYYDKGPDNKWFTEDDLIASSNKYEYSNNFLFKETKLKSKGIDHLWNTADDIIESYKIYLYNNKYYCIRFDYLINRKKIGFLEEFICNEQKNNQKSTYRPYNISLDNKNNIFIIDTCNNIRQYNSRFELQKFNLNFECTDIKFNKYNHMYIGSNIYGMINKYDTELRLISSSPKLPTIPANTPYFFSVDSKLNVFAIKNAIQDQNNSMEIIKFNNNFISSSIINRKIINDFQHKDFQKAEIICLAIDNKDQIYISIDLDEPDSNGYGYDSIIIYSKDFQKLKTLGGNWLFNGPCGIAFDNNNFMYVINKFHNNILVFNDHYELIAESILYDKESNYILESPSAIAIKNNKVFVVDNKKQKISIFSIFDENSDDK